MFFVCHFYHEKLGSPVMQWCRVNFVSKCPTDLDNSRQGLNELAVGVGGGCLGIFSLVYFFSFLSPSLWETAQYRLKYCLNGS